MITLNRKDTPGAAFAAVFDRVRGDAAEGDQERGSLCHAGGLDDVDAAHRSRDGGSARGREHRGGGRRTFRLVPAQLARPQNPVAALEDAVLHARREVGDTFPARPP